MQRFCTSQIYNERKRISSFIIDETVIQIGNHNYWLWIATEPIHRTILGIHISNERNIFVVENFIRSLVSKYGRHTVYTDGGTWYPQACRFLHLKHRLHSSLEKSLIERVMQYFKDRIESFDDYYPCINQKRNCNLQHAYNWIKLFIYLYNERTETIFYSMLEVKSSS